MSQIINNLNVKSTKSVSDAQSCTFDISNSEWIFSYKCCEVEGDKLRKGGDYAFTLTFGNMGECLGKSFVTDILKVRDIGGVQLKIMDYCGNNGYITMFLGLFYYPGIDQYFFGAFSLEEIVEYNLELVICPRFNMYIAIFDEENETFYLPLEAHIMECLGILFQVEDIFCEKYDLFDSIQDAREKILIEEDFELSPKDLDIKLNELKVKLNKDFKEMK